MANTQGITLYNNGAKMKFTRVMIKHYKYICMSITAYFTIATIMYLLRIDFSGRSYKGGGGQGAGTRDLGGREPGAWGGGGTRELGGGNRKSIGREFFVCSRNCTKSMEIDVNN